MKLKSLCLTVYTILLIVAVADAAKKQKGSQCSLCKEVVQNFQKGVEKTRKSNYGGGNTDWEERALGDYANSEVRLVEIMENLCDGASKETGLAEVAKIGSARGKKRSCHQFLEQFEEVVEDFWFNSGLGRTEQEFHQYFCVEKAKACCPNNTYGPNCKECTGGKDRPCFGNGKCDGEGTRAGSGKCRCNHGYKGDICDSCLEGYYENVKNDTHTVCNVCHIACKTSCNGDGPKMCDACKDGWIDDEKSGCQDINECETMSTSPCKDNEYCTNTQGSYSCLSKDQVVFKNKTNEPEIQIIKEQGCNVACRGCTGPGFTKCVECNDGYFSKDEECLDVDECTAEGHEERCTLEGQKCVNTAGSFKCICQSGYVREGEGCKLKPKDGESKWLEEGEEEKEDGTPKPDQQKPTEAENTDTPPIPNEEL